jgi:hypothetical protein
METDMTNSPEINILILLLKIFIYLQIQWLVVWICYKIYDYFKDEDVKLTFKNYLQGAGLLAGVVLLLPFMAIIYYFLFEYI